jgi:tetratricopeptide (TPR) repeat protein
MVTPEAPPSSAPRQPEDPPKRDPKQARALVKRGLRAASNADFEAAESFFHQALEHDDRSDAALAGLAEVHFDLGHYQKTISYGKRAARLAPKKAPYRITLGDAYFRTNQYPLARREYTKAAELGHARAKARLQQLKARLGD